MTFLDVYKLRKHQNIHSLKKQLKTYTRFYNDIRDNPIIKLDNKFHKEDKEIVKQELQTENEQKEIIGKQQEQTNYKVYQEAWIEDLSKVHEKSI